ncbi:TIGR00645 family protein [Thermaurantiacus sp.]
MSAPDPESAWQTDIERALFASRWLVVPFYFGLLLALLMLFTAFAKGLITYVPKMLTMELDDVILVSLALIDIALVANLVVIVVLASYEMMVSRIDTGAERPGWMGGMGFGDVKLKLFSSIVAISGIQLLKTFMGLGGPNPPSTDTLFWLVVVHATFVVSTLLSALAEWVSATAKTRK